MSLTISSITTVAYIDTVQSKTVFLPSTFNIEGKILTIKDRTGSAGINNIRLATLGGDTFENSTSNYIIAKNFGLASFIARRGIWYSITDANTSINENGPSSLSSIVSYGLSTVAGGHGVSSLSSIVAYGLSTVNGGQGVSSLSSIVAYGLSSLEKQPAPGVSSLSSIVAYGLSSLLEHVNLCNAAIYNYYGPGGPDSGDGGNSSNQGVSSLSSIVAYGLSTVYGGQGISSLSSIVTYGLSSIQERIRINIQSSNIDITTNNVISLHNKTVVSDASGKIMLFINDTFISNNTVPGNVQSVYNNGSLIVGVGSAGVIIYSSDGSNWSNAARNPLPGVTLTSVTYANGLWVATGSGLNTRNIIYSRDGSYWVQNPYIFPNALYTVAYNSNYWIVGGENDSVERDGISLNTLYRTSDITTASFVRATTGGFGHRANVVEWGSSNWVAVGQSFNTTSNKDVQCSADGINWSNALTGGPLFFGGSGINGNSVAYGNSNWLICGGGQLLFDDTIRVSSQLFRSQDGINFSNITTNVEGPLSDIIANTDYQMYDLKYSAACNAFYMTVSQSNGLSQYFLKSTNNGDSWTTIRDAVGPTIYRSALGYGTSPISNTVATTIGNGVINTTTIISCNMDTTNIYSENIYVTNTITVDTIYATTIPIVSYGLSSLHSPTGISSLSSIVAYGLSSVNGGAGVSSLSSIVAYGLSSVAGGLGLSSLSSIVAYGLSSVNGGEGISSLSSIVAYGLSSVAGGLGLSSLSSIVAYGLSSVAGGLGLSSLSSIVAYGLSSVNGGEGISSLSSIVAYGLSSVNGGEGISSLSSIVAYGLSSVNGGEGISSISSIVAYGLSSVNGGEGISSLSSIVAYSLSTVFVGAQLLGSNTYNYSFKVSSIGGTEIVDTNSNINNPDTITNAFAKVDNWLFTNMIAPPPAPTFVSATSNSTSCTVTFKNPNQFLTGFLPQPFPFINRLHVRITSDDGTVLANSNFSNVANMPFPGNTNVISNVRLSIQAGVASGYSANTFILSNSEATGKTNFTFNITWLNNNTILTSNTLTISNISFASAALPNAPTGLIASGQTRVAVTLTYTAPTLSDPLENYSNVLVTFCNMGYTNTFNSTDSNQPGPRRFGVPFTSIRRTTNTNVPTVTFTGLTPDTPVMLSAATKITTNPTYVVSSNIYSRTTLPTAPPSRIGPLTFPGTNNLYYTNNGIPVTNRVTGGTPVTIINSNNITGPYLISIVQPSVAIHTAANPGSTSNSIMRITCSNALITFNGYNGTPPESDNYSSDNNFLIRLNEINDFYGANTGSNGFYTIASLQFGVSKHFIVPSVNTYTFITTQSNEFVTPDISRTTNLNVDLINTTPSNLQSYNTIHTGGTPYFFCSGVLSFTSNLVINSIFSVSNIASYYITHPTIGTYIIGTGVTSNILTSSTFYSDLNLTNLALTNIIPTNTILVNSNVFITNNLFNLGTQTLFTNRVGTNILNLTTTFSNIFGTGSTKTNEFKIYNNAGFCNIYFDIPSKMILDSMNSSNSVFGIRVESGRNIGADVVEFGGFFEQSNSLAGTYSNEIQLVNGFFQTTASPTDGYINYGNNSFYNPQNGYTYPDYTSINSAQYRYLTVQFNCNVSGRSYNFFSLNIEDATNFTMDSITKYLLKGVTVQYKIFNATDPTVTTAWLDGNLSGGPVSSGTKNNIGQPGFYKNVGVNNSTESIRYLQVVSGTGASPFITYIRFGVPLNQDIRWKRLFLTFISSS